ncbi:hypothetical protein [Meridianimarinicoccus roseus]|nr:hypothetical protein [Meridianimarinicoccus roseus]
MVQFFDGLAGVSATLETVPTTVTASSLAGIDLYISARSSGFSASEAAALSAFETNGGALLILGENSGVGGSFNSIANDLLTALGSGMRLGSASIGSGFLTTPEVASAP